jgi:hypothetical protein
MRDMPYFDPKAHYGGLPVRPTLDVDVLKEGRRYTPSEYWDKIRVLETSDGRHMWYYTPDNFIPPGTRVIQ